MFELKLISKKNIKALKVNIKIIIKARVRAKTRFVITIKAKIILFKQKIEVKAITRTKFKIIIFQTSVNARIVIVIKGKIILFKIF